MPTKNSKFVCESMRSARLKDGASVVGQSKRVAGRKKLFNFWGKTIAERENSDAVTWHWSRQARIADTGEGRSVEDAAPKR